MIKHNSITKSSSNIHLPQPWLRKSFNQALFHRIQTSGILEIMDRFQVNCMPFQVNESIHVLFVNFQGLDIAQCFNGFIYHTKYDLIDVIPRGAFQNTGDNVLSLIRALANATELRNTAVNN